MLSLQEQNLTTPRYVGRGAPAALHGLTLFSLALQTGGRTVKLTMVTRITNNDIISRLTSNVKYKNFPNHDVFPIKQFSLDALYKARDDVVVSLQTFVRLETFLCVKNCLQY